MTAPTAVVVDDSHFVRTIVSDALEAEGVSVVGTARNGREGVSVVESERPDVVTMDVEMPEMDGLAATEAIMERCPTPILMLSAHTAAGSDTSFEALDRGAVDVFPKPDGEVSTTLSTQGEQLAAKVREVAQAEVSGGAVSGGSSGASVGRSDVAAVVDRPTLVIGGSTGAPNVIESVVSQLPLGPEFRVLIVQHMPESFTGRFADRLDTATEYAVSEASDGQRIGGGEAVVAPGGRHLEVVGYARGRVRVQLDDGPPRHGSRPSIDVTMQSAAEQVTDPLVGVLLTGMGEDGTAGMESLAAAGATTIAQSEASAAVDTMPGNAIASGCVEAVAPPEEIVDRIMAAVGPGR